MNKTPYFVMLFGLITTLIIITNTACGRNETGDDMNASISNSETTLNAEKTDNHDNNNTLIRDVMFGRLLEFPNVVIGDVFENFFSNSNTSWERIENSDGNDVVIFTAEMIYGSDFETVSVQFNYASRVYLLEMRSDGFLVDSIFIDGELQDAFTSRALLFSIIGDFPDELCGTWVSEDKTYEFHSDGTGLLLIGFYSEDIVWMVNEDKLFISTQAEDTSFIYELTNVELRLLCEAAITAEIFIGTAHQEPMVHCDLDEWYVVVFGLEFAPLSICIPTVWNVQEHIYSDYHYFESYLEIIGENNDELIQMFVTESPIGDPYMILDEAISYEQFQFDDGSKGYMAEVPSYILWLHLDPGIIVLRLQHDGNRSIFIENEETILHIVQSLRMA